jgi:hypothetical protein
MGPDLSGPHFNTSCETIDKLAKRAKANLFGADANDTKSIAADLMKDEDDEEEEKAAAGAMTKAEKEAKNSNTTGNNTEEDVGVS